MKFLLKVDLTEVCILGLASIGTACLVSMSSNDLRKWRKIIMAKTAEEIAALDVSIKNLGDVLTLEMDEVSGDLAEIEAANDIDLSEPRTRLDALAKKVQEFTATVHAGRPSSQPAQPPTPTPDNSGGADQPPVTPIPDAGSPVNPVNPAGPTAPDNSGAAPDAGTPIG